MSPVGLLRRAVVGPSALAVVLLALGGVATGDVPAHGLHASAAVTGTASAPVAPCVCEMISGTVFADRGADGALDPAEGDTPIGAAPVALSGRTGRGTPLEVRTATEPDGRYSFSVPAGTYRVVAPQPPGFDDGPDVPGRGATADGDDAFRVVLPSGASSVGNVFAELPRSGLGGAVFDDVDGDGERSEVEPGIPRVPVTLTGTDEAGNSVRLTAATAGDGAYSFPRLRPGEYAVTTERPVGFLSGAAVPGTAGGTATGPTAVAGIALGPDTTATGYDFAAARPARLSGALLHDGGAGVPGVPVTVSGRTPAGTAVVRSTSTAPDGRWTVPDLPIGTYTVLVPLPPGFGDGPDTPGSAGGTPSGPNSISGIALASGEQADGYVFTLARASISGHVFVDLDGDGSRGSAEPGLPGVAVTLSGTDVVGHPVTRSTSTGPDGSYRVDALLAGTYAVTQAQPAGFADGVDSAGSAGGTPTGADTIEAITPAGGADGAGYDFGERGAQLAGVVTDQGGAGLPGAAVTLTGTDTTGAPVERATSTGPDGTWALAALPAGTYAVSAAQPAGYGSGPAVAGTAGGSPAGPGVVSGIALGPGEPAAGYRFTGTSASVTGTVFLDRDRDGVRAADEEGVGGVTVTLSGTDVTGAAVERRVTSGAGGRYRVDRLLAGQYAISEVATDEFAAGSDRDDQVTVPAGASVTAPDAGVHGAQLRGRIVDGTGVGVPGVAVTASGSTVRGRDARASATTGADGRFTVPGLPAGRYTLTAEQPTGHGDGPDDAGSAGGAATAPNTISGIELAPGQEASGYRFRTTFGSLGGVVFADLDGDGSRGPGEPGIADVVVTVTGVAATGAAVEIRAATDRNGEYVVDGLLAGTYRVTESQPAGYACGGARAGTAGGATVGPDVIAGVELAGGDDARGYAFHEWPAAVAG